MAHWLGMRYGISDWKAHRWIAAAHALEDLPLLSEAFSSGELGIDKVVELTRFATPKTEARLIPLARGGVLGVHPAEGRPGRSVPGGGRRGRARPDPVLVVLSRRTPGSGCPRSSPRPQGGGGGPGPGAPGRDPPGDAGGGGGLLLRPGQAGRRPGGPVFGPDGPGHPTPTGPRWSSTPSWTGSPQGRVGVPSREARPSTPRPPGACCVTGGCRRSSRTLPAGRWAWAGRPGIPRQPCSASSGTATPSAPSPGAGLAGSPRPITSCGGSGEAGPIWTT